MGRNVPPLGERNWVHPSELPNFDKIPVFDAAAAPRPRRTLAILVASVAVIAMASIALALKSSSPPQTSALRDHIAHSIHDLPSYAQAAATSAIELLITDVSGHVSSAAAMVIEPGNLALTTEPIPENSSIVGSSASSHHIQVSLVTHDKALGFTVVRLGTPQPIAPTGVLPASATVLAIAPYFSPNSTSPEIAYATTVLGDPVLVENGIVSYLLTQSEPNLGGFADTLAVDGRGNVVAVLSEHGQWYSAQYITKVADVITANGGCHGRLGITGQSAQGGGVVVVKVDKGPSWGHLNRGDILESANGVPLDSLDTLLSYLYASPSKEGVLFSVMRNSHPIDVGVVLGCQP
jgi:hypothetical protein